MKAQENYLKDSGRKIAVQASNEEEQEKILMDEIEDQLSTPQEKILKVLNSMMLNFSILDY